jgi:hypothetical protein
MPGFGLKNTSSCVRGSSKASLIIQGSDAKSSRWPVISSICNRTQLTMVSWKKIATNMIQKTSAEKKMVGLMWTYISELRCQDGEVKPAEKGVGQNVAGRAHPLIIFHRLLKVCLWKLQNFSQYKHSTNSYLFRNHLSSLIVHLLQAGTKSS